MSQPRSSGSHSTRAEDERYATGNSSSWDEEVDEDQYHDADHHDDDDDDGGGGAGGGGGGGQGEDALYAQWLQNFRDERDSDPDWANWSDDDDFLLGRNYF